MNWRNHSPKVIVLRRGPFFKWRIIGTNPANLYTYVITKDRWALTEERAFAAAQRLFDQEPKPRKVHTYPKSRRFV